MFKCFAVVKRSRVATVIFFSLNFPPFLVAFSLVPQPLNFGKRLIRFLQPGETRMLCSAPPASVFSRFPCERMIYIIWVYLYFSWTDPSLWVWLQSRRELNLKCLLTCPPPFHGSSNSLTSDPLNQTSTSAFRFQPAL